MNDTPDLVIPPKRRRLTYRDPWGVGWDAAHRYGYPLPRLTPVEELALDVAELRRDVDLALGMALLDPEPRP